MPARATLHGTIEDTGGENCDERGFEWGEETGVYPNSWTENGSFGTGVFEHIIDSLDLDKTYFFRAKAHNSEGWGYGTEKQFTTPAPEVLKFRVPMIRMVMRPVPLAKTMRGIVPISLRRSYIPFGTQKPVKGEFT